MSIKYASHIDLLRNELQNAVIANVAVAPKKAKKGQIIYNTTVNKMQIYDGTEWVNVGIGGEYVLPVAKSDAIGGVKSGTDITVDSEGNVSVNDNSHSHIIGNITGLTEALGNKVEKNANITGGTATKITYDAKGLVTKGETLTAGDIPDLSATYIKSDTKGAVNGVASLNESGKIPTSQLPSYVDDVVEVANFDALPQEGEAGKIYVTTDTNKTYRWGGSTYVEISASIVIGTTEGTAFDGGAGTALQEKVTTVEGSVTKLTQDTGLAISTLSQQMVRTIHSRIEGNNTKTTFEVAVPQFEGNSNKILAIHVYNQEQEEIMIDKKTDELQKKAIVTFATAPIIGENYSVEVLFIERPEV